MAGRGAGDGGKSVVIGGPLALLPCPLRGGRGSKNAAAGRWLASCAFEERAEAKRPPRRNVERRCRVPFFPGDPGNKPRPLPRCAFRRSVSPQKGEMKLKAQLARRREDESAWLFEICIGNTRSCPGRDAAFFTLLRGTG